MLIVVIVTFLLSDAIPVNIDIINLSNLETREYSCRSRLLGSESNPRSQYLKLLQEEFR